MIRKLKLSNLQMQNAKEPSRDVKPHSILHPP